MSCPLVLNAMVETRVFRIIHLDLVVLALRAHHFMHALPENVDIEVGSEATVQFDGEGTFMRSKSDTSLLALLPQSKMVTTLPSGAVLAILRFYPMSSVFMHK